MATVSGPWAEGVTTFDLDAFLGAGTTAASRWGFQRPELARLRQYFRREGRGPTDVELAGIAQSWSEHCSYKSSRPFLRAAFGASRRDPRVLGTGDAGVMQYSATHAYALRIESHNHPSAIEPYGGAATGIGGIVRDVLAVGGKPIALADPLFFGPLDAGRGSVPDGIHPPRYIYDGVIAGIRDYGNRIGVPTITGSLTFDPSYTVNPLVNVACLGFLPRTRFLPNRSGAVGDHLLLVGGLTGRDGIGGVSFASKEVRGSGSSEERSAVQLGNPIMKEPVIHGCLEAFDRGLVRGVKDLGGGGLASASGELVHAGGFGSAIALDRVPLRETGLSPWEIWISESQERMLLDVAPRNVPTVLEIFRAYEVPATDIGETRAGHYESLTFEGRPAAHLSLPFRIDAPPALRRTARRRPPGRTSAPMPKEAIGELAEEMILAPDVVSREPVIRMYDHEVQGRTAVNPLHGRLESPSHGDAAVIRPLPDERGGLAATVASHPWSCAMDPYLGAVAVVEEAARNLYAVGAIPDALTNCLNFGNPEDPHVLGDFAATVRGLADGAGALGMAVPSGNVSFYNGGRGRSIPPTPVVFAVGRVDDVRRCLTSDLKAAGNALYLVGASSSALGASLYSRRRGRFARRAGPPPPVNPEAVRRAGMALVKAASQGTARAIHDLSDGGLIVTLAEMGFGGGLGFQIDLARTGLHPAARALVAEGSSRWVVEVVADSTRQFERSLGRSPFVRLGGVTEPWTGVLREGSRELARLELSSLYERWRQGPTGDA
ncbi:MAG: phosphoribosylformylglycinamidine synthase subunit PurL [Thermoplasmata archaeon]|nr:phosphoribosylformylglycinamidine synthase subunit PurL [Thermoplasmata archaeon]